MPDIVTMPPALMSFAAMRFNLITASAMTAASVWNQQARLSAPDIELWQAELSLTPLRGDDFDVMEQFISSLRGGRVLARIYDQRRVAGNNRTQPQGSGPSTGVVVAADVAAGAETISLKNLTTSQAVALKAMDQFQVGENLYRVQNSGPSDSSGEGTFSFRPAARHGFATNDPVVLVKPTGLFRLGSGGSDFGVGRSLISEQFTLSFTEEPSFEP